MQDDLSLGLCTITVLALIVIAMSVYKIANPPSCGYFNDMSKATLPHVGERSDLGTFVGDGANERPVFWNQGSFEETNAALQAASREVENNNPVSQAQLAQLAEEIKVDRERAAAELKKWSEVNPANKVSFFAGQAVKSVKNYADLERLAGSGI